MLRRSFLFWLVSVGPTLAHSAKHGGIAIGHSWSLPTQNGDGQAFFPVVNNATTPDALIAARSNICATIELRRNARYDDPAEKQFELLPNQPMPMRPQARHLRLVGLKLPLNKGEIFPLILDFQNAGEIEVNVYVEDKPGD
jgi:periplasmic copper chaperone A